MAKAKRTKKVQVTLPVTEPKSFWQKTKDFFYNSHNIVYNFAVGSISAVGSIFALVDWSPVMNLVQYGTGFSRNQLFWTSAVVILIAAGGFITRVVGTKSVDGHLLPKVN